MTSRPAAAPPVPAPRRLFVRTWGCQMNVYDSLRMQDLLRPLGYGPAEAPDAADMVIVNTCHIREKASEKLFSELGRLRAIKAEREAAGEKFLIAVAGCVAQAEGEEILARAPFVDLVTGPQSYHRLPEMVARVARAGGAAIETDFAAEEKFDRLAEAASPQGVAAFLTVQEGCDKFCTFCVVPYTRGAEISRPMDAVLAEAGKLAEAGAREITLIGQNVNAWHGAGPDGAPSSLAALIRAVARIPGVARIRYTTSHPLEMGSSLIAAHADEPKLMPWLHLPVQSGSDRTLRAMNRRHTAADYLAIVEKLRAARPDLGLSTDFIVGFPSETDADFQATLDLVRQVGFAAAFSFKYSARPGTPAATMHGQVPDAVADARLAELQALLSQQQRAFNAAMLGRTVPVLWTGPGRHPGQVAGRTPWLQPVHMDSGWAGPASLIGQETTVRIRAVGPNSLAAEPTERDQFPEPHAA